MMYQDVNPIDEVRKTREAMYDKYGGMDGLNKHIEEVVKPKIEALGFRTVTLEEVLAKKNQRA